MTETALMAPTTRNVRVGSILALAFLMVLTVWYRGHTLGPWLTERVGFPLWPVSIGQVEPLDCDEALYAYIGHRINQGDRLYVDLTENKPPVGYWLYAGTVALGGLDERTIRMMPIPLVLLTLSLIWWVVDRLAGPLGAFLAGWVFLLTSTDPYVFGNGANMEHALNLLSVAALAMLIGRRGVHGRIGPLVAGILLGLAILIKQMMVVHLAVAVMALTLPGLVPGGFRCRIGAVLWLAIGVALPCASTAFWLGINGSGSAAFQDIVGFGAAIATDLPPAESAPPGWYRWLTGNADPEGDLPWPFGRTDYLVWWGAGCWPIWAILPLATIALVIGDRVGNVGSSTYSVGSGDRSLVAAWSLAAASEVILPGQYWQHYYLLLAPFAGLCLGVLGGDLTRGVVSKTNRLGVRLLSGFLLVVVLGTTLATTIIQCRDYLGVPAEQLTKRYKGGGQWIALRLDGASLESQTQDWPERRLFVWGWQSPLYVYGSFEHVTPLVFVNDLVRDFADREHPQVTPRLRQTLEDLRADPPEIVFCGYPPFPDLWDWLKRSYRPPSNPRFAHVPSNGIGYWVRRDLPTL